MLWSQPARGVPGPLSFSGGRGPDRERAHQPMNAYALLVFTAMILIGPWILVPRSRETP